MLRPTLLFLLLASSAVARSQPTCPWLTEGSASSVLGGDVSIKVGEGSCRFLRPHDRLEILVSKAALASCPRGSTALKGIGNQAARCKAPGSHSGGGEMISGRVRDLHFTVTRTADGQKRPVKLPDAQQDALEQIAEQIAGNLF